MTTTEPIIRSAPANLRDLGGIPLEGGSVRPGFALRADDLSVITAEAADELVELGLTTVIDLRAPEETAVTGRGVLASRPVTFHHLPLVASLHNPFVGQDPGLASADDLGASYARIVESAAPRLVSALAIIAFAPGATAFHCAGGKDRTGVLAAMLLLALGAPDEAIVADYAATGENIQGIYARMGTVMGRVYAAAGLDISRYGPAITGKDFSARPMTAMLSELRSRYGAPLTPLADAGLDAELIGRLRTRAVEPRT